MDAFFKARVYAEKAHGLLIGLDRCASIAPDGKVCGKSWYLFINGVSHRCTSVDDATSFLNGYCACCAASAGAKGAGDVPFESGREIKKVMGA